MQRRIASSSLPIVAALFIAAQAAADEPASDDVALAETLFREGRREMGQANYASACTKLAESQRLDPGGGTLLALALCHEKQGRTASAWAEFEESIAQAVRDKEPDREKIAREHEAALEPALSRLTVVVAEGTKTTRGLLVKRDGTDLAQAAWGVSTPVDPGEHIIEASAPGHATWWINITVAARDAKSVLVPALSPSADVPAGAKPRAAETNGPRASSAQRTAGWILGGVGVVGVGVATGLGIKAISDGSEATRRCPTTPCSDHLGVDANDRARTFADVSTTMFIVSGVALGVGALLILTTKPESRHALQTTAIAF